MSPTPSPPRGKPEGFGRETFQASARSVSRDSLMAVMRAQAEEYFGGPVTLREATARPEPGRDGATYYWGTSRWVARP